MREILFRGKRADNGEWAYGYYLEEIGSCIKEKPSAVSTQTYLVLHETVGQYTGLNDKNGKKIFEGDILSAHLDEDNPDYETVVQVIWEEYGWRTMEENGLSDPLDDEDAEIFAIIGNIHDNPELLKGGEGNG